MREEKISWKKWAWAAGLLMVIFVITWLPISEDFIEQTYSERLYKGISAGLHFLLSWVSFSIGDVLYISVIIYFIYAVIVIVRAVIIKRFKIAGDYLFKLVIGTEVLFLAFYILWGFNYSRPAAAKLLGLQDTTYTINDVKKVTRMIIDSVNTARAGISIAELTLTDNLIYSTAVKAINNIGLQSGQFKIYMPSVKSSLLSPLLNYMGTSGYFNPFTGEAQINNLMPVFDKPFTACHEMSHQMGFGREDEANFVGYLAGVKSNDRLLKYSAYYEATVEFLHYLHRRDTMAHHQLKALLSAAVKADLKTDSLYWTGYNGPLGAMSSRFYDGFLKANKQPAGLRTYNRMIRLTMAWYKRRGIY